MLKYGFGLKRIRVLFGLILLSFVTNDALSQQNDDGSVFVTLFIARQADSSKVFKAKRTNISKDSHLNFEK